MNRPTFSPFKSTTVSLSSMVLACGLFALSASAQTPVDSRTLVDQNATAKVDVGSSMGMYDWSIGGQDQLQKQWFWYRVEDTGPQYSIDSIASRSVSQPAVNKLNTIYTSSGSFSLDLEYTLHADGNNVSYIDEAITIQNLSGNTLEFYFFQYSDFNLGGYDVVEMDNYYAFQQNGLNAIAEGIIDPAANFIEANTTGGSGSTLSRLTTESDVELNDAFQAAGDVTWAFEWYFEIGVGQSAAIVKDKALTITLIPEPTTLGLIAFGLLTCGLARRRQ